MEGSGATVSAAVDLKEVSEDVWALADGAG